MHGSTIVRFMTSRCGDRRAVGRGLEAAGIAVREVDVERDEQAVTRLVALAGRRTAVPTLELGRFTACLWRFGPGKLDAFLKAVGLR